MSPKPSFPSLIAWFLKGVAMGAANVIPGVSGGTVAFITGIYERLINGIKSLNFTAAKLLFTGKIKEFISATDFTFLAVLGVGVVASILSLARVFKYLFAHHPVHLWAFFFGLILASIWYVGVKVKRWGPVPVLAFALGTATAVGIALMKPASENDGTLYLMLCGVVAMASMIMPGISGSFVLLLMGNYQLIMIDSVAQLSALDFSALRILAPVGIGAIIGLASLSHFLSWVFRRHHDFAVALLTGFVAGSLLVIWPWKREIVQTFGSGEALKTKVVGYEWLAPSASTETYIAFGIMIAGMLLVWIMERLGGVSKPADAASEPV